jgi:hypothetical protein
VRSRPRLTVRQALTAWYLLVLGVVIAGFAAALYWDQEQTLSAQVDRSLSGASGQAMALIDKHVDPIKFVDNDAYTPRATSPRQATRSCYSIRRAGRWPASAGPSICRQSPPAPRAFRP